MLIRFAVSNFLSIKAREEISFVASRLKEKRNAIADLPGMGSEALLPCAIIYGANASGKSNLLAAISFMRHQVLMSHSRNSPEGGLSIRKFLLDSKFEKMPTAVEVDFLFEGVRYEFGFEATEDGFTAEWLFSYPEGRRRKIYNRTDLGQISFGSSLKGQKQVISDLMRPNSLFISTAIQNNHDFLTKISKFFVGLLTVDKLSVEEHTIDRVSEIDARTIGFLKAIGTGVVDYRQRSIEFEDDVASMIEELFQWADKHGPKNDAKSPIKRPERREEIELAHVSTDGSQVFFRPSMESSGTRRLLVLLNSVFKALDDGLVVIVDELDASLHTHAIECIVELFANRTLNRKNAQLIAATHDTNLLNSEHLRRDEIWFSEKSRDGASKYYSLSDIRSRQHDDFESGYLQGRYGAIPYSGSILSLMDHELRSADAEA